MQTTAKKSTWPTLEHAKLGDDFPTNQFAKYDVSSREKAKDEENIYATTLQLQATMKFNLSSKSTTNPTTANQAAKDHAKANNDLARTKMQLHPTLATSEPRIQLEGMAKSWNVTIAVPTHT